MKKIVAKLKENKKISVLVASVVIILIGNVFIVSATRNTSDQISTDVKESQQESPSNDENKERLVLNDQNEPKKEKSINGETREENEDVLDKKETEKEENKSAETKSKEDNSKSTEKADGEKKTTGDVPENKKPLSQTKESNTETKPSNTTDKSESSNTNKNETTDKNDSNQETPKEDSQPEEESKPNPYLVTNPSSSSIKQKFESMFHYSYGVEYPSYNQYSAITQEYADGHLSKAQFEDKIKSIEWESNGRIYSAWYVNSIRFTTSTLDVNQMISQIDDNGGIAITGMIKIAQFSYDSASKKTTIVVMGVQLENYEK